MLARCGCDHAGARAASIRRPIVYMVCIFAIFYFLAIRPQSQRQKQQEAMIKAVKTGDKIVTSSGIHGMVSNVKETTLIVKIADNVKIELDKSSVGTRETRPGRNRHPPPNLRIQRLRFRSPSPLPIRAP